MTLGIILDELFSARTLYRITYIISMRSIVICFAILIVNKQDPHYLISPEFDYSEA